MTPTPAQQKLIDAAQDVRQRAYAVTDGDVEQLKKAFSEDEIFEQTVAVAITEGLRRYDAAIDVIG